MSIAESQRPESIFPQETLRKPSVVFGTYLPEKILTNQEIESWNVLTPNGNILTADNIQKRTGVAKRYVADSTETPLTMGLSAAQQVLNGKKADVIIVSTSFPVGFNVSQRISEELGLSPQSHLDVHAACSGFTLSLAYIKEHEQEFLGKKILFVAAEKYSPYLHDLRSPGINTDPSLAQTIFSDGAIAMVFEYGKDLKVISAINKEDFPEDTKDCIKMPIDKSLLTSPFLEIPVLYPASEKFEQDGPRVYKLMCENIPPLIKETIRNSGVDPSTIQMIAPHQGSGHMVDGISQRLNGYSVYNDFEEGNFSSASIPKALNVAIKKGEIKKGNIVVLAGFGAGLFASVAVVKLG